MAFSHGKKLVLWVDNAAGALTNISTYVTRVGFPRTVDVAEVSVVGKDDKDYLPGQRDGRLSFEGKWDPTVDAHLSAIWGQDATVSVEYGPEGGTTGKIKYSFEAILISYEPGGGIDDATNWTAELQKSGAVTRGTFA